MRHEPSHVSQLMSHRAFFIPFKGTAHLYGDVVTLVPADLNDQTRIDYHKDDILFGNPPMVKIEAKPIRIYQVEK